MLINLYNNNITISDEDRNADAPALIKGSGHQAVRLLEQSILPNQVAIQDDRPEVMQKVVDFLIELLKDDLP